MAAAAVAETVALRARPEPGIRPGGPSLLRTPAEPSSALAGRGCLLPGKQMRALRGPGVRGRGTRCQFGRPAPGTGLRSRGSCGPASPERAAPSAPRSRGGVWLGGGVSPGGRGLRGRGAGRRGHVTGLFTNTAELRRRPAAGAQVARVPRSGLRTCVASQASLGRAARRRG